MQAILAYQAISTDAMPLSGVYPHLSVRDDDVFGESSRGCVLCVVSDLAV
jgi:hypothetical protein